jgi:hypothetical protein
MTDPASAIKREVSQFVELQIQAFRQDSSLTSSGSSSIACVLKRSEPCTKNWIELEEGAWWSDCAKHPSALLLDSECGTPSSPLLG